MSVPLALKTSLSCSLVFVTTDPGEPLAKQFKAPRKRT
jgi:hypothetical protein